MTSGLKVIEQLLTPLNQRNIQLKTETHEEKIERIKKKYGLEHGKGIRKRKQKNKRKNK